MSLLLNVHPTWSALLWSCFWHACFQVRRMHWKTVQTMQTPNQYHSVPQLQQHITHWSIYTKRKVKTFLKMQSPSQAVRPIGRAQPISRGKMSNFTAVFGKKCQISWKFHGRLFVAVWNPKTIYLHWYIRPICVTSKQSTLKMPPTVILLFIDKLTGNRVACSHGQLLIALANYKRLIATVQAYIRLPVQNPPPSPYKTSTKTVISVIWLKVMANVLRSTGTGKILKCISKRANCKISRKTDRFTVRVMAMKSRNRLGPTHRAVWH